MASIYKHAYETPSVYGNVVSLLREQPQKEGIHVDIGCGYGAIAEPVRDELGLTYVGFDLAEDGLADLRERGFEAHQIDLTDTVLTEMAVLTAVGDRAIASLSFLDTLEHLPNGIEVLSTLRRVAEQHDCPLILSVPNVTHKDLALKLLIGRWDVTEAGLLDHTHLAFYSNSRLDRVMATIGWEQTAARDWLLEHSDQEFPSGLPVHNPKAPLGNFLRTLIDRAHPHGIVNQFVRAYRVSKPLKLPLFEEREESIPFLSVVVTIERARMEDIRKLLGDLVQQTNQDFHLSLILVAPDAACKQAVEEALLRLPRNLRHRTNLIASAPGGRVDLLNDAIAETRGRYLAILSETDRLTPDWVMTLSALADREPGAVLRVGREKTPSARVLHSNNIDRQLASAVLYLGLDVPTTIADFAVPSGAFHQLGLRLDSTLEHGAEWSAVVEASILCGLANSPTSSDSAPVGLHDVPPQAAEHYNALVARLNGHPLLLPAGAARRIYDLYWKSSQPESAHAFLRDHPMLRAFVRRYAPVILIDAEPERKHDTNHPFLSIIMRTRGRPGLRIQTLREGLMTLAGQSCQDFEVLVIVHNDDEAAREIIGALVDEFPPELSSRIRVASCYRLGRSAPLNEALQHARGVYFAVLDDDDFVFSHWVETFKQLASKFPSHLLRATCVRQDFQVVQTDGGAPRARASSWFIKQWPEEYDAVAHLHENFTPFMSVAFPRAVFAGLGWSFDESQTTAEDWQLATRMAMICGVASSPEVTAVYRWWTSSNSESSSFEHHREEWLTNRERVIGDLDRTPIILPPGSVSRINALIDERAVQKARAESYAGEIALLYELKARLESSRLELEARYDMIACQALAQGLPLPSAELTPALERLAAVVLLDLVRSRSWRMTRPIRLMILFVTGQRITDFSDANLPKSGDECVRLIQAIRNSSSWRITRPLRAIAGPIRRLASAL